MTAIANMFHADESVLCRMLVARDTVGIRMNEFLAKHVPAVHDMLDINAVLCNDWNHWLALADKVQENSSPVFANAMRKYAKLCESVTDATFWLTAETWLADKDENMGMKQLVAWLNKN